MANGYPRSIRASRGRIAPMLDREKQREQPDLLKATIEIGGIELVPDVRMEVRRLLKQLFIACTGVAAAEVRQSDE
jgi:hypothetical protein